MSTTVLHSAADADTPEQAKPERLGKIFTLENVPGYEDPIRVKIKGVRTLAFLATAGGEEHCADVNIGAVEETDNRGLVGFASFELFDSANHTDGAEITPSHVATAKLGVDVDPHRLIRQNISNSICSANGWKIKPPVKPVPEAAEPRDHTAE